jgi:hypothetical protein
MRKHLIVIVGFIIFNGGTGWSETIASPMLYDQYVEPLPRAEWLEHVMMFCMPYTPAYINPGNPEPTPWARRLQEAGFVVAGMYTDGFCRLYAPTQGETWPGDCHAEVKRMHALGMKCIAGAYPFVGERGPRDLLMDHPEWRLRREDKVPDAPGNGCMVNPGFADALRNLLVSRIKEYDIDGYQFDGWYQSTYCRCDGCKSLYQSECGKEVPGNTEQSNVDFRKYVAWRNKKLFENLVKLREAVKSAKPDFVLVNWNNNDTCGAVPSWMPESLNCVADWTNKEWWSSFDVSSVWLEKRLRGSSGNERPPGIQPYMFMRWMKDIEAGVFHGSSTPMPELRYRLHEIMTMGGLPITWPGARAGWTESDWNQFIDDYISVVPFVQGTKSLKYALCIDSYTTLQNAAVASTNRAFHEGEGQELELIVGAHRGGIARALLEAHIPFDVASEHNLTPELLDSYQVVILPNNNCMSEKVAGLIRDYVNRGGGLVATFETSLCDEWGKQRGDFALADLFGAKYRSTTSAGPSRIEFAQNIDHPLLQDPAMRSLMGTHGMTTYWGAFARVEPSKGSLSPLSGIDVKNEKDPALKAWNPLIIPEREQGKVVYFPSAMDAAYFDAGYPYQRMLISDAVRWAAGEEPSVSVDAPMCVLAGYYTRGKEGHQETIIHLLNGINSTTGHGSKNEKEMAMREEVIPISGIKVSFVGATPKGVRFQPDHVDLEVHQSDGTWSVDIPPLDLHGVVVAEY